ncbi:DUF2290 domain-containing protein [Thiohalorhabdus sp. Cl-TMA]|uniref:DUF2290 domain-containing protein n=1 Tax=Thiohalorhabdus methylotrophus TaxID=3242694 RepID=A0ABV4TZ33_9GAMM
MASLEEIREQITRITSELIKSGLCDHQNYPSIIEKPGKHKEIVFDTKADLSTVLKNQGYKELYEALLKNKAYNFLMVDGAIIQLMYSFHKGDILGHRLAFFPCPNLLEYQNIPEIYENDEVSADIISEKIVTFPIRFDFDNSEEKFISIDHPKSHLTLGEYRNCRIPVSAPLTPFYFMDFILRSFYDTRDQKFSSQIPPFSHSFSKSISNSETEVVHLQIPSP